MRSILTLLILSSFSGATQIINEYKDSGSIASIECNCVQGHFKKSGELKFSEMWDYSLCLEKEIIRFDSNERVVYDESIKILQSPTGSTSDRVQMIYEQKFLNDSTIILQSLFRQLPSGEEVLDTFLIRRYNINHCAIDSTFDLDGQTNTVTVEMFDSTKFFEASIQLINGEVLVSDTIYYNSQYVPIRRSVQVPVYEKNIMTYYSNSPNVERTFSLNQNDTTNYKYTKYNDRGLKIKMVHYPAKKNDKILVVRYTFDYIYDEFGNWIERRTYNSQNKLIAIERRRIVYRNQ